MKRFLSMILIGCMMMLMASAAMAETAPTPSIEDILNDYHEKAFAVQSTGNNDGATTYSRSAGASQKTLEQETVEELTAAGYEAYNVTAENYDALETSLQTDFEELGLDDDGSYIVVISGEENSPSCNPNSRAGSLIDQTIGDVGVGSEHTKFTYDGITYTMRYVTVTAAFDSRLFVKSTYNLDLSEIAYEAWEEIGSAVLGYIVDTIFPVPIVSMTTFLMEVETDSNLTLMNPDDLSLITASTWTRNYIQILNETTNTWHTAQCSAYVKNQGRFATYVYSAETNDAVWYQGSESSKTTYSRKYADYVQRKTDAVEAYLVGNKSHDRTGDVKFYFDPSGEFIEINGNNEPLFVHNEPTCYILPIVNDEE